MPRNAKSADFGVIFVIVCALRLDSSMSAVDPGCGRSSEMLSGLFEFKIKAKRQL